MNEFKYNYIYSTLEENFKFDENQYGKFIKDILTLLMESEKNGETFINIDNNNFLHKFKGDKWPNKHLEALKNSGLIYSKDAPIIFENRKLSFDKWSKKTKIILDLLLEKINKNKPNLNSLIYSKSNNEKEDILKLFDYSNLVFLQGGPGTGKSTLILEIVLFYLNQNNFLNIGLAAPTGKASSRLKESLENKKKYDLRCQIDNIECQTLHRWIFNSINKSGKLKYLLKELDFFVIDEMSMVNIDLLELILNLLAQDCKLLLVGDSNQLPPINSCSIWNYIFSNSIKSIFNSSIINLQKVYRNNGDIEELSKLIFMADNEAFNYKIEQIVNTKKSGNVNLIKHNNKSIPESLINEINLHLKNIKKSVNLLSKKKYIFSDDINNLYVSENYLVKEIFNKLNSQLILCKTNSGVWGVNDINELIIDQNEPYDFYKLQEGVPIMCTENNNVLGISNGDIGVVIGKGNLRRFLFRTFNKFNNQVASLIEPDKLVNVIPALAITIHKSQGSESNNVSVLWNQNLEDFEIIENNYKEILLKNNFEKRLFYTAITRAKKNLKLYYLNS